MKIAGMAASLALAAATGLIGAAPLQAQGEVEASSEAPAELKLWRLSCGDMPESPLYFYSDTMDYAGKTKDLPVSCYLIKHGDTYMMWDTGFGTEYIENPADGLIQITMERSLLDQLGDLGLTADEISILGISHNHGDHVGQAADFPGAKLLIGAADLEQMRTGEGLTLTQSDELAPWLDPASDAEGVTGDKDVFGDGSVVMLAMPGHTRGHHALLVRLPETGPVLLSGDQYHFTEQMETGGVPPFNWNRAETLASHERFVALAKNVGATIIIQHEPGDVGKLPAFPEAAE